MLLSLEIYLIVHIAPGLSRLCHFFAELFMLCTYTTKICLFSQGNIEKKPIWVIVNNLYMIGGGIYNLYMYAGIPNVFLKIFFDDWESTYRIFKFL